MKNLVLGGDGLIGREVVRLLRERGDEVVSCDRERGCDAVDLPLDVFASADRVWFLAWDTGGSKYMAARDRQHLAYKNNCDLSSHVFDALATVGTPFLFATSQLAGERTAYGLTKLMAEAWSEALDGKVARLWNVYGWERPSQRSHVVTDLIVSGLAGGQVICSTDGTERRRLLYKSDCAAALIELFDGDRMSADVAGPRWLTVGELAGEVARQLEVPVQLGAAPGQEVMIEPTNPLSGWEPAISLSLGVSCAIDEARRFLAAAPSR